MIARCQFWFSEHELFILLLSITYSIVQAFICTTTHMWCTPTHWECNTHYIYISVGCERQLIEEASQISQEMHNSFRSLVFNLLVFVYIENYVWISGLKTKLKYLQIFVSVLFSWMTFNSQKRPRAFPGIQCHYSFSMYATAHLDGVCPLI